MQDLPRAEAPGRLEAQPRRAGLGGRAAHRRRGPAGLRQPGHRGPRRGRRVRRRDELVRRGSRSALDTTADATAYHVDASRGCRWCWTCSASISPGSWSAIAWPAMRTCRTGCAKCIGHRHQKAIAEAAGPADTKDPGYLNEWKLLFTMVNALWKHRAGLGDEEFVRQRGCLEAWLDRCSPSPGPTRGRAIFGNVIGKTPRGGAGVASDEPRTAEADEQPCGAACATRCDRGRCRAGTRPRRARSPGSG